MSRDRVERLVAELRDAYDGHPWYGDSLRKTLDGIDPYDATAKPLEKAHSIAELVGHITAWIEITLRRLDGEVFAVPRSINFPPPSSWKEQLLRLDRAHRTLVRRVAAMTDDDLDSKVAGKRQTVEYNVRGVVQHCVYHQGQIAMLSRHP